jgi:hypothetical protein
MLLFMTLLAVVLVAIPSACLALLIRAERKREEMDKRYLRDHFGQDEEE